MLYQAYADECNIANQHLKMLSASAKQIHREMLWLADFEPIFLRDYVEALVKAMGASSIPIITISLAKCLVQIGDALNGCMCLLQQECDTRMMYGYCTK